MPMCRGRVRSQKPEMESKDMYKFQENRLSDPRDEFCDEYKGKYGDNEGHGEEWLGCALPVARAPHPTPR